MENRVGFQVFTNDSFCARGWHLRHWEQNEGGGGRHGEGGKIRGTVRRAVAGRVGKTSQKTKRRTEEFVSSWRV